MEVSEQWCLMQRRVLGTSEEASDFSRSQIAYRCSEMNVSDQRLSVSPVNEDWRTMMSSRLGVAVRFKQREPAARRSPWVSVVSMVRNEADVIRSFIAHNLELVDRIVIVDHMSEDGTCEVLDEARRADPRIEVLTYNFRQYFQSAIVTALVRREARRGAAWVLPLDADEFLAFSSRQEFLAALNSNGATVKHFVWQNLVPANLVEASRGTAASRHTEGFVTALFANAPAKVAVSRRYVRRNPLLAVGQGSHHVIRHPGGAPEQGQESGGLIHIPIRSIAQAREKFATVTESVASMAGRNATEGTHVQPFNDVLGSTQNDDFIRNEIGIRALNYGAEIPAVDQQILPVEFRPLGEYPLIQPAGACDAAAARKIVTRRCRNASPRTSNLRADEIRASIRGRHVVIVRRRFERSRFVALQIRAAFCVRFKRALCGRLISPTHDVVARD